MKRFFPILLLALITAALLTAASPLPTPTFTLVRGLPSTMKVGDQYTVVIRVDSDQEFLQAQALPSFGYPGKGVVAIQGGDHSGPGSPTLLEVTFEAKSSTSKMPDGVAPVYVVTGVRYAGGYVAAQEYIFYVAVP